MFGSHKIGKVYFRYNLPMRSGPIVWYNAIIEKTEWDNATRKSLEPKRYKIYHFLYSQP